MTPTGRKKTGEPARAVKSDMSETDLYSGLIRLHVLYHAVHESVFGLGLIEELRHHGYQLSAGTLYPILHGLEKRGYLRSTEERIGRRVRRVYRATAAGRKALGSAKQRVQELFGELFEKRPRKRMRGVS